MWENRRQAIELLGIQHFRKNIQRKKTAEKSIVFVQPCCKGTNDISLAGVVELDDTYFGKPKKGGKRGRGTKKTKVVMAVSKSEDGKPRYIKMKIVPNPKSATIGKFATQNIAESSKIEIDAYNSYRKPLAEKYDQ